MKFSVVIPTYKRPDDLRKCISSILNQSLLPEEVLIIDDDDLGNGLISELEENCFNKTVKMIYNKKDLYNEQRGSSASRNKGLQLANNDIVFIFDDDIELYEGFFEHIMKIWETNNETNLVGVGGVIVNNRKKGTFEKLFNKVFLLDSRISWDVNDLGFQVWNDWVKDTTKGYYAHGGVCSYNKRLAKELGLFKTFSGGRTALEDVEFCLRAKKNGCYLMVEPKSRAFHHQSKAGRENEKETGYKEGYNRVLIYFAHCHKNSCTYLKFRWASFGWVLRQLLVGHYWKAVAIRRGTRDALKEIFLADNDYGRGSIQGK
ncbi:glycosyltransferase family 2 protein [Coprothermobacter platensis]|uniref:glycosyltransferase family 2 protein n=1 Tax=Coprothermobacter platensis TaxID=108819 RepID=UPI000361EC5E|nr:glycosyltransferase family 2 protein [Coprothermobacter platensis]